MSFNYSLGWIGIAAFESNNYTEAIYKQCFLRKRYQVIYTKENSVCVIKRLVANIVFPKPRNGKHTITVAIFAETGRSKYHRRIYYISGLKIGTLSINSVFHAIPWMPYKLKRLVSSIYADEILAAAEEIEEGKILKSAIIRTDKINYHYEIQLFICIVFNSSKFYRKIHSRRRKCHPLQI